MIMKWVPEYNTGIDVIDDQHRRILDYINEIDAIDVNTDRERVKQILENIIDYTQSHFTFEESSKKKQVINIVCHTNVYMIYLLKKLNLIVTVLSWGIQSKLNCMKCCRNG